MKKYKGFSYLKRGKELWLYLPLSFRVFNKLSDLKKYIDIRL